MTALRVFIPHQTPVLKEVCRLLADCGVPVVCSCGSADAILLPVPTPSGLPGPEAEGRLCIGGNLAPGISGARTVDLLQDPRYLQANAKITAEAALGLLLQSLPDTLEHTPTLLLGWGRIARHLAALLRPFDVPLTVCARSATDRSELRSRGITAVTAAQLPDQTGRFRCLINTVPAVLLEDAGRIPDDCFCMELASGVFLPGDRTLCARGLPARCKPLASAALIAGTILPYLKGAESI